MTTERLLLCRPMGGLNDMLCQIEQACRYADRYDRTVIVDTRYRARFYFRDSFSNYFASLQDRVVLDADAVIDRLDQLDVFPRFLTGRVTEYDVKYDFDIHRIVEAQCGLPTSFDFNCDYAEPLIVHHAIGGGTHSIGALARLRIATPLLEVLLQRLVAIGGPYSGVHVRNTDYRAKYRRALVAGVVDTSLPLFLATDNRDTVAEFRAVYADRVHAFARLPDQAGTAMHHIGDLSEAYERNQDSILDLIMLALASHLYLFELEPNRHGVKYSGFSMLAASLHNDKPVLKSLISTDEAVLTAVGLNPPP
jgi:hypothetical protein